MIQAAKENQLAVLRLLLQRRANPNLQNLQGEQRAATGKAVRDGGHRNVDIG